MGTQKRDQPRTGCAENRVAHHVGTQKRVERRDVEVPREWQETSTRAGQLAGGIAQGPEDHLRNPPQIT